MSELFQNLALGTAMVCLTVATHFIGLIVLMRILQRGGHRFHAHESLVGQGGLIVFVVLGIAAIHMVALYFLTVNSSRAPKSDAGLY